MSLPTPLAYTRRTVRDFLLVMSCAMATSVVLRRNGHMTHIRALIMKVRLAVLVVFIEALLNDLYLI